MPGQVNYLIRCRPSGSPGTTTEEPGAAGVIASNDYRSVKCCRGLFQGLQQFRALAEKRPVTGEATNGAAVNRFAHLRMGSNA